jgi:copper homeostasis protein
MPPMHSGPKRVLVEVCVASVGDAGAAQSAGAHRVELNAALELGGLTPSLGTLLETRQAVAIPIITMVRPRSGGFCYDQDDFRVMLRDAELMVRHGADGLAFGILTDAGRVDVERCAELIGRIRSIGNPLRDGFVFHRAFDFVADRSSALEDLIRLGVRRVMTSGGAPNAIEGATEIAKLVRQAEGRIEVLPAGGIRGGNVARLVALTGCQQVHASARTPRSDPSVAGQSCLSLGSAADQHVGTDPRQLAELLSAIH